MVEIMSPLILPEVEGPPILFELVDFMRTQPEWSASHNLKTIGQPSSNSISLDEVRGELKEKRFVLANLNKRIDLLERDRFELEEAVKEEQLANERALVALLREKFMRDEQIRVALEARIGEQEAEIEKHHKKWQQELKLREDALANADALRNEVRMLEERIVQDEQTIGRMADNERQLFKELDDLKDRLVEDETIIARFRENERQLHLENETLAARVHQLEHAARDDGTTIVEMRDTERALRSDLDQCATKIQLLDEQGTADEQAFILLRENVKNLQLDNDNLHAQNLALDAHLAGYMETIGELRDNEVKMKRRIKVLEEATEEIDRLRAELNRLHGSPTRVMTHTTTHTTRSSPPASPVATRETIHTSTTVRPPSPAASVHEEVVHVGDVAAAWGSGAPPFTDLSVRLDSLQQKLDPRTSRYSLAGRGYESATEEFYTRAGGGRFSPTRSVSTSQVVTTARSPGAAASPRLGPASPRHRSFTTTHVRSRSPRTQISSPRSTTTHSERITKYTPV